MSQVDHEDGQTDGGGLVRAVISHHDDPSFYVRAGQALAWLYGCSVAGRSAKALDEISQALQIRWVQR